MRYLPKSPVDREEMLAEIGAASIDDLFSTIPAEYQLKRDLKVPRQHGESEILDRFRAYAENNAVGYSSFLGAGVYRHYRPVIIDSPAASVSVPCTRPRRPLRSPITSP